jgi:hypothetical protein
LESELSKKEGASLYKIGSEPLPNNTFSGYGKDICIFIDGIDNCSKKSNWTKNIMEVKVGSKMLNLLKDYGRNPMDALKRLRRDCQDNPTTTLAEAPASISSTMMFKCIDEKASSPMLPPSHSNKPR